ncbi:DUF4328 domain-containing protein [Streptomyces sp. SID3343]|uniref:DUF4328 domain-containing protein n=1 Tax=Streptomyces sp. SID3343 TaxID=2690260 RepID=UPI00136A3C26
MAWAVVRFGRADAWSEIAEGGSRDDPYPGNPDGLAEWLWTGADWTLVYGTIVLFLVWFHRARANVETYPATHKQTFSRGWAIGGWFCPAVNLAFPPIIAQDVWKAGDPRASHRGTRLRLLVVWSWWTSYAGATAVMLYAALRKRQGDGLHDSVERADYAHHFHDADTAMGVGYVLLIPAAALAIAVIARITTFQNDREHSPLPAPFTPWPGSPFPGSPFPAAPPGFPPAAFGGPPTTAQTIAPPPRPDSPPRARPRPR